MTCAFLELVKEDKPPLISGVSMSLIDFILNIACLLLWINWQSSAVRPAPPGVSILCALKPAGPPRRRWLFLCAIGIVLLVRALFYWQAGPPLHWVPRIPLGPISLPFRSDLPARMLLFSVCGFAATVGIFYLCLLLLSCLNSDLPDTDAGRKLVRVQLSRIDGWPNTVKLLLPGFCLTLLWCAFYLPLTGLEMVPRISPFSPCRLVAQGAIAGAAVYLLLKYFFLALMALYLLNGYVYLGESPFWDLVNSSARSVLRPFRWLPLRIGPVDLAPLLAAALFLIAAQLCQAGLSRLYQKLL
jgi:uncharacterized protein YggT (Ycf19 family)